MNETHAEQADILEAMIDWYPLARTKMALRAGAQALREMPQWWPIETAPKDGTPLDLWVGGARVPDCSWRTLDWEIDYMGAEKGSKGWADWSDRYSCYGSIGPTAPTHWMPLPPAPSQGDVDDDKR